MPFSLISWNIARRKMIKLKKWGPLFKLIKQSKIFSVLMLFCILIISQKIFRRCMKDFMVNLKIKIALWEKTLANKKILQWQKAIDLKVYLGEIPLKKWVGQTQSAAKSQANSFIKYLYTRNYNRAVKSLA